MKILKKRCSLSSTLGVSALVLASLTPLVSQAEADFFGTVTLSLKPVGGAINNTFAYAGPIPDISTPTHTEVGNAFTVVSSKSIHGQTDYVIGDAQAAVSGGVTYRLGNLTGGPDPTPPAKTLQVTMEYTISYTLHTHILSGGADHFDYAGLHAHIYSSTGKDILDVFLLDNEPGLDVANQKGTFTISLPPSTPTTFSVTETSIFFDLSGFAFSIETHTPPPPPPPPFPSQPLIYPAPEVNQGSFLLFGMLGLGVLRYKSRRNSKIGAES